MAEEGAKGHHLEQVLFSLLDFQSRQGADQSDTMLMLGLLNLLGIVSLMNKQAGRGVSGQVVTGSMHPMLNTLLQMMGGPSQPPAGQGVPGERGNPGLPLNPALLMGLLNQKPGQGLDPALLLSLLGSMMGGQGTPGRPSRPAQEVFVSPVPVRETKTVSAPTAGGEENRRQNNGPRQVAKWGARLEKEKKA